MLDERASHARGLLGLVLLNAHRASPISHVEGMFGACVASAVMHGATYDVPGIMLAASETESRRKLAAVASGMKSVYFAHGEEGLVVMFASWTVSLDAEWAARMLLSPTWTTPGARKFGRRELCVVHYQAMRAIAHARGLGVVHGNVCPANIVVGACLFVKIEGWDTRADDFAYCAPEVMLCVSPCPYMKCDVFSLGLVMLEALRRVPLVPAGDASSAVRVLRRMMRTLGSPCSSARAALGVPASVTDTYVAPLSWIKLLRGRRVDAEHKSVLRAMLDWNPETRPHAAALMCAEHFYPARLKVTAALTRPEVLGLVVAAFECSGSRGSGSRGSGSRSSELSDIDE